MAFNPEKLKATGEFRRAPGLVCPECCTKQTSESNFVITRDRDVKCRMCFHARKGKTMPLVETKDGVIQGSVFKRSERMELDWEMLVEVRELVGITKPLFARRAGWSRSYQQKLETGQVKTVSRDQAELIMRIIRAAGAQTLDEIKT